jgi:hypothetical protein
MQSAAEKRKEEQKAREAASALKKERRRSRGRRQAEAELPNDGGEGTPEEREPEDDAAPEAGTSGRADEVADDEEYDFLPEDVIQAVADSR